MPAIRTILCPVRLVRDELDLSRKLNRLLEQRDAGGSPVEDPASLAATAYPTEDFDDQPIARAAMRRPTGAAILLRPCTPSPDPFVLGPIDENAIDPGGEVEHEFDLHADTQPDPQSKTPSNDRSGPPSEAPLETRPDPRVALPTLAAGAMPWAVPQNDGPPNQRCRWVFVTDASSASLTAISEEAIPEGSWWQTDLGPLLGTPLPVTVVVQVERRVLEKTHRLTFQIIDHAE